LFIKILTQIFAAISEIKGVLKLVKFECIRCLGNKLRAGFRGAMYQTKTKRAKVCGVGVIAGVVGRTGHQERFSCW
jgi:hypothetical protein